jgi:MFS family permease
VQAGQILAAAVFIPLARFMPRDAFMTWGWRVPFLLSLLAVAAGYVIRRRVPETPVFAGERAPRGHSRAPIVQAFAEHGADMLRVSCMSLMNVIPVVTTIFGAAYAIQPAYGIGMAEDVYLWIPVLGNCVAVLIIPFVGAAVGSHRAPAAGHRRFARRRPARVRLSAGDQPPQRAAGDRAVAADVGRGVSGL